MTPSIESVASAQLMLDSAEQKYRAANYEDALRLTESAIKSDNNYRAWNLKGSILNALERYSDAFAALTQAVRQNPALAPAHANIAKSLLGLGRFDLAIEAARRAMAIDPRHLNAILYCSEGLDLKGEITDAITVLTPALEIAPTSPEVLELQVSLLFKSGRIEEALAWVDRAVELFPDNTGFKLNRAKMLLRLKREAEALAACDAILKQEPKNYLALWFLGDFYFHYKLDRIEANKHYRASLDARFDLRTAAHLCSSLTNTRGPTEAACIDEAHTLAAKCSDTIGITLQTAQMFLSIFHKTCDFQRVAKFDLRLYADYCVANNIPGALQALLSTVKTREDRRRLLSQHRRWGELSQARADAMPIARAPRLRKQGKVRIGIMSSDLGHHPVSYFALPIFKHYDRDRVEIYVYAFDSMEPDNVQRFIMSRVTMFRKLVSGTDRELAQTIAQDEIDIMFDLGGTTYLNRPNILSWRVAPIQVSWLGYPHSLGLPAIDYLLVDPYLRPSPDLMLERPLEMPHTWVSLEPLFFGNSDALAEAPPILSNNYATFGTANNPQKYSPELLALWARVLNENQNSRFLFIRPEGAVTAFRENILGNFMKHGVAKERIEFRAVRGTHMSHYNDMDISLDCAPLTGGTTTWDSLWMGVPVVTRVGESLFERMSYSSLNTVSLGDLCAGDADEYVAIASTLAKDVKRLKALKRELRPRIRKSPAGNTQQWVRDWENLAIDQVRNK